MTTDKLARAEPTHLAAAPDSAAIELVLVQGDLSKLSAPQRVTYYNKVCESVGLNPLTRPFEYLNLNGALRLYARRDCTDQLRKIHNVTVRIVGREQVGSVYVVTAQALLPNGRSDESTGAVPFGNITGEAAANALMKAETKAKRRVTLSICGLSVLDESELDGVRDQIHPAQQIGPHSPHDDGSPPSDTLDPDVAADLIQRMTAAKEFLQVVDSYDKALQLREILGSSSKQSKLTKDVQAAKEARAITVDEHRELSKIWAHCNRQCAKLEKELAPKVEDMDFNDPAVDGEADPDNDGR
jgi:hypothetical protein